MTQALLVIGKQILCPECLSDEELVVEITVRTCFPLVIGDTGEPFLDADPVDTNDSPDLSKDAVMCLACQIDLKIPEGMKYR